jgi:predicted GIY-YIG superfamily endonuclease
MPARKSVQKKPPVVYFLQPKLKSRKSYIGYTIDLHHRWRQHRGEIKGGAKRTRGWKDAVIIAFATGFPDQHSALSFEWWAKRKTGKIMSHVNTNTCPSYNKVNASEHARLKHFHYCLYHPKFKHLPLRIVHHPTIEQVQAHQ